MKTHFQKLYTTSLSFLFIFTLSIPLSAGSSNELVKPVTTSNPSILANDLKLILVPLNKNELLVEANGWQEFVKDKANEIAETEMMIRRQNREIEKTSNIVSKARKVNDLLDSVVQQLSSISDAVEKGVDNSVDIQKQTSKAHDLMLKVIQTVKAEIKAADVQQDVSDKTRQNLDQTMLVAEKAKHAIMDLLKVFEKIQTKNETGLEENLVQVKQAITSAQEATAALQTKVAKTLADAVEDMDKIAALNEAAGALEETKAAQKEEKVDQLELLTEMREVRTLLLDNMRAVVDELQSKTDTRDTDTLAKITDYRLYISGVSGISLDVTDTTSTWISIKSWIISEEGGLRWLTNLGKFVLILLLAWYLAKFLSILINKAMEKAQVPALLADFLTKTVRLVVMIIGIIWALAALEVSIAPLLAMVGATGFILAFAMQESLSNFASGTMILMFRPFDIGDVVEAGGVSGTVNSMNIVSTTIRTFDNKMMVVPNSKIWSDVITNVTGVTKRRVDLEFGIGYECDADLAQNILEDIVSSHPKVLKYPEPTIKMNTLSDSSVNFICRPWARPSDYWDVYWDVTKEVKQRFGSEGISIPFPQRDIHVYFEGDVDKDKARKVVNNTTEAGSKPVS